MTPTFQEYSDADKEMDATKTDGYSSAWGKWIAEEEEEKKQQLLSGYKE